MRNRFLFTLAVLIGLAGLARAEVQHKVVNYTYDGTAMKGYLAWDDAVQGPRPGILVVHEWWGLNDYARKRADMLAKMGYVAFAADMYGEGKTTEHPKEASAMAGMVRKNLKTWEGRALTALKVLQDDSKVDSKKLASIGYCFGGSTSLQLALAGAPIKAAVSFHGALPAVTETDAKKIQAKVLVCHGADDAFIPQKAIDGFKSALDAAKTDYIFESYPGAVHSFTVEDAGKHGNKGMAYHAEADRKSWESMKKVFKEAFSK